MKRIICLLAAAVLVLSLAGCSLFADSSAVKLGEDYTHHDPDGISYDQRVVLSNPDFGTSLEDYVDQAAYPDTMVYDESGNPIGIYDYDPATGLAGGWTNIQDGSYTPYEEAVDLGKPDESLMLHLAGGVKLYFVVYGKDGAVGDVYSYLCLENKDDFANVSENASMLLGFPVTKLSDTVLQGVQTGSEAAELLNQMLDAGFPLSGKDAQGYAQYLQMNFGVKPLDSDNPYKPYAGHTDPEGLVFDERVVLTGSGQANVDEAYASDIVCVTDYVYGSGGKVVAHYTYCECTSKDAADKLMEVADQFFFNPVRISDTVIGGSITGSAMDDLVSAYMGYNVLKDNSLSDYVRMLEETYFSLVAE